MPLGWFTRAAVPPQAVALSSSSSLASLPALVESARALGLPTSVTGFVLPLSVSTFKVATPITWMMGILFLARLYGVELPTPALVVGRSDSGGAEPDAAGRSAGCAAAADAGADELRHPAEGVGLLLAADTIPDLMGTMTNVTGDLVVGTVVGGVGRCGATLSRRHHLLMRDFALRGRVVGGVLRARWRARSRPRNRLRRDEVRGAGCRSRRRRAIRAVRPRGCGRNAPSLYRLERSGLAPHRRFDRESGREDAHRGDRS